MNKRIINLFFVMATGLLLASCASQNIAYMQTLKTSKENTEVQSKSAGLYEARIKPKDLLLITVSTPEAEASKNYNLTVPQISDGTNSIYGSPMLQTYLVDNDGNIDFPVIGRIPVSGYSRKELETQLQKKLGPAFSKVHPVITIRITNYSVNVLGEVARPGKYSSTNDRLTIFEGLALAGDMTIYGRRDNVKVLRESADGSKTYIYLNLNDKNIINSPAYNLEQNDVVYVEPNKAISRGSSIGSAETLSVNVVSILISVTSLLVNIFLK